MAADNDICRAKKVGKQVQAHLVRPAKRADKKPRDWLLFFFFRILDDGQIKATRDRILTCSQDPADQKALWLDFAHPTLLHAQQRGDAPSSVSVFRDWLKMVACADNEALVKQLHDLSGQLAQALPNPPEPPETPVGNAPAPSDESGKNPLLAWVAQSFRDGKLTAQEIFTGLRLISNPDAGIAEKMPLLRACLNAHPSIGSLPVLTLFEILRQAGLSVTHPKDDSRAAIRSADDAGRDEAGEHPLPVNLAFTFSGLKTLGLNPLTLASFPDAFKEGMAARAARLHDTGPSDPVNWEGELGLPSIHGYFSAGGGFAQGEFEEAFWKDVRRDVAAFNDPADARGEELRYWMSLLFRSLGMEIVHVELGQDPYTIEQGHPNPRLPRVEHFGFRDGLSQPFVDLGLAPPPAGGGSPARDQTWTPVAPGEIFLDQRDVNGVAHRLPISAELRAGSTFLVFRKLEQNVAGFRTFLALQRPGSASAQEKLAAQFMGRWPNGAPLVLSPHAPLAVDAGSEAILNDFRYADGDPYGDKCPLGAHTRRTNPRDIGGRGQAGRHRILRRSISYGGPLLPDNMLGDGERRGLLFLAANARIDVQFEVIQSEWMNGGEFLGQAGLGRCPILGANNGRQSDSFLESGACAPVTGLPRFVITQGGDYFFAPGVSVVKALAHGETFAPKPDELPYDGYALADSDTPGLFSPKRLRGIGTRQGQSASLRVATPDPHAPGTIVFVARHSQVQEILRDDGQCFSVRHYREAAQQITRGDDMLIGTDVAGPTASSRKRLSLILDLAWTELDNAIKAQGKTSCGVICESVRAPLDMAIRRTANARRIDLVGDLATAATYAMLAEVFGVPGPTWLTEMAASLPFGRQHVGDLPLEWIAAAEGVRPENPGQTTLQIWSILILADLIGNLQVQSTLRDLSRQAGSEMLNHIDGLLTQARRRALEAARAKNNVFDKPTTLLEAMVYVYNTTNDAAFRAEYPRGAAGEQLYYRHAATVLLEVVGTSLATIPLTFASVMDALFDFRIDLANLMPLLQQTTPPQEPNGVQRLIHEAERLNPNAAIRMRYCEADTTLGQTKILAGEWVGCFIKAANLDPAAFPEPERFSLSPYVDPTGPVRDWKNYLLFGDDASNRKCWGRDRVALVVLEKCLRAAARLKRLRRPAGLGGRPRKIGAVTIGLPARFTGVA